QVSATNQRWIPADYIDRFPLNLVGEIHLPGLEANWAGDPRRPLAATVRDLYKRTIRRMGAAPTRVESDVEVPEWQVLLGAAGRIDAMLDMSRRRGSAT